ncbi:EscU/YscU/HrcU family type III secretion system export apparatus switch protein [Oceanotoga sp. DSM 15011]|jgi:flagellar biosynthesis protein|uniref:Flagellar biosynthesis protein n=1 Tax=Oceanotoga teriensis TaxID=515440 RepID=A0AA45C8Y4_9BACT|nr:MULTISPECIES: EscU/YscU/HrcU family type III secretion system export apparatus switch protein [Oceanotoga]MDN5343749.1 flagellar biosynthesis protein [Oceanotoga sp.]MDO7977591.1 EscU/YscU/HrcU family type III secretion system export apparatus switch protein [Oceanotoga teriensis]PWJ96440.1 flagellar biosynthesis protein [Oceanotoga teriensis]UYP00386.1 EscU/YscU/HrcU family type III secretion system export apparatus switch protein [Oceanotoga sp. DSM 15011]
MNKKKAIALRYKKGTDKAPKIVAKGINEIADKIIERAEEERIPIIKDEVATENFYGLDLNLEIPPEMYKIAAEIIAYVYTIDKKGR